MLVDDGDDGWEEMSLSYLVDPVGLWPLRAGRYSRGRRRLTKTLLAFVCSESPGRTDAFVVLSSRPGRRFDVSRWHKMVLTRELGESRERWQPRRLSLAGTLVGGKWHLVFGADGRVLLSIRLLWMVQ